jgi:DnaJ family protein C protein 28
VRTLTINNTPALLHTSTQRDIKAFRDPDWEQRERSYHEAALKEVNSLVRKYNCVAPYTVRRPFYVKNVEMDRLYGTCAEEIWRELAERAQETVMTRGNAGAGADGAEEVWSLGDHLRKWTELVSKLKAMIWSR